MATSPPASASDLPEIDVRTVAVVWSDSDGRPRVMWSNCSPFEALGMARAAVVYLEREFPLLGEDDEDFSLEFDDDED